MGDRAWRRETTEGDRINIQQCRTQHFFLGNSFEIYVVLILCKQTE